MRLPYFLLSLSFIFLLSTACQQEEFSGKNHLYPEIPMPKSGIEPFSQIEQVNEHVSFRFPRFPRPKPCPVLAGCQIPAPEFMISVVEGGRIQEVNAELYTEEGEVYASSHEEFGGEVAYGKSQATASLGVLDDQVTSEHLTLGVQVIYEVNGEEYAEEFFEENVPISWDDYEEAGNVMFRFPRFPRPKPCPVLAGCQIPAPELHTIVPEGSVLEMTGQLYTSNGELYACAGEECESAVEYENEEALATFTVVNPEIEAKSLNLVLQITYEIGGEVISEEIYSENVPIAK